MEETGYLIANGYNWDGTTAGNKIAKALTAKAEWCTYSTEGTIGCNLTKNNRSGFAALPGSVHFSDGYFGGGAFNGCWWSATVSGWSAAFCRCLSYGFGFDSLNKSQADIKSGFSVRLVKD